MIVFGRREQDQLDPFAAVDIGIMPRRDLEEVAGDDPGYGICVDHSDDRLSRDAISGVAHRTRRRKVQQGLFILFPRLSRLEDRMHACGAVAHPDDGNGARLLHVQAIVRLVEPPDFDDGVHRLNSLGGLHRRVRALLQRRTVQ